MAIVEQSPNRIRELYQLYRTQHPWDGWFQSYRKCVMHYKSLSDDQFRSPQQQENLWRARDVASLGPGEAVSTTGAYTDAEIANALVGLRTRRWPDDPGKRARAVQDAYNQILELVHPRHSDKQPQAKLGRAFAALLPENLYTGFNWKSYRNITRLVLGNRKVDRYEGAVLVRARLRSVLGKEDGLDEHIHRSMFCWWLHEHYDTIAAGESPVVSSDPTPDHDPEQPKLTLWSFAKQRKGLTAVTGYVDTYRAVVSAARGGATPDDIVDTMLSDMDGQNPRSCRRIYNRVRRLGFLEHRNGLWHPSAEGEELVEADPPDILVEKFLIQTFGLAHYLRLLKDQGSVTRKEQNDALRKIYPAWTTNFMPGAISGWAQSLGLMEQGDDKRRRLTEYGRALEARLPEELPTPDPKNAADDVDGDKNDEDGTEVDWPDLKAVVNAFATDAELASFIFSEDQIRALHLAWHCHPKKRFVILSGLSGTGKTALLVHYARIYATLIDRTVEDHREIVAVSPDWRDPSGLLGYLNALHTDATFQAEPALRLVLAAAQNPGLPYFLILDEMNLARVERYFAPFLSSMETGAELALHAHDEPINDVPPSIDWPSNLFIGGTVNMDETTHPFSDKVLDRAFTLEFYEVELDRFLDRRAAKNNGKRHDKVEAIIKEIYSHLRPIRRHFGYRTADEVLDFIDAANSTGGLDDATLLTLTDQALFSKVLPRLRGEQTPALQKAINAILALSNRHDLKRCRNKLLAMRERLQATGVTRFWS